MLYKVVTWAVWACVGYRLQSCVMSCPLSTQSTTLLSLPDNMVIVLQSAVKILKQCISWQCFSFNLIHCFSHTMYDATVYLQKGFGGHIGASGVCCEPVFHINSALPYWPAQHTGKRTIGDTLPWGRHWNLLLFLRDTLRRQTEPFTVRIHWITVLAGLLWQRCHVSQQSNTGFSLCAAARCIYLYTLFIRSQGWALAFFLYK